MYMYQGSYEDLEQNASMVMGNTLDQLYNDGYLTSKQHEEVCSSYVACIKRKEGLLPKLRDIFFPKKRGVKKMNKMVFIITKINPKHHE